MKTYSCRETLWVVGRGAEGEEASAASPVNWEHSFNNVQNLIQLQIYMGRWMASFTKYCNNVMFLNITKSLSLYILLLIFIHWYIFTWDMMKLYAHWRISYFPRILVPVRNTYESKMWFSCSWFEWEWKYIVTWHFSYLKIDILFLISSYLKPWRSL